MLELKIKNVYSNINKDSVIVATSIIVWRNVIQIIYHFTLLQTRWCLSIDT